MNPCVIDGTTIVLLFRKDRMQNMKFEKGDLIRLRSPRAGMLRRVFSVDVRGNPDDLSNTIIHDDRFYIVTKPTTKVYRKKDSFARVNREGIAVPKLCEVLDPIEGLILVVRRNDFEKAEEEDVQATT